MRVSSVEHVSRTLLEPGNGRSALVVVPHADDAALRCGGLVLEWVAAGWTVVLLRVTDDSTDSVALDRASTITQNRRELELACEVLGISDIIDLGFETDTLADVREGSIREQIIRQIRTYRPHSLATFDPSAVPGEDNQDHLRVAAATDEACWASTFDKHHPEQLEQGLELHGVFERWYFARGQIDVNAVVDIEDHIDTKIEAVLRHRTMMENLVRQIRLQGRTGGLSDEDLRMIQGDDPRPLVERLVRSRARSAGRRHGLRYAEEYRRVVFGGLGTSLGLLTGHPGSQDEVT